MARNDDLHYILDKISTMNYEQFCAFVQCPQIQQLLKKRSRKVATHKTVSTNKLN